MDCLESSKTKEVFLIDRSHSNVVSGGNIATRKSSDRNDVDEK